MTVRELAGNRRDDDGVQAPDRKEIMMIALKTQSGKASISPGVP